MTSRSALQSAHDFCARADVVAAQTARASGRVRRGRGGWRAWGVLAALLLATAALSADANDTAEAEQARPGPTIWRIADENSEIWLYGSHHMLPEGVDWRRPALDELLAGSDVIYFEADVDGDFLFTAQATILQQGFDFSGRLLMDQLTWEGAERLQWIATMLDVDIDQLNAMRPWLALIVIQQLLAERIDARPEFGVEGVLHPIAERGGMEIRYLEGPTDALTGLSETPETAQLAALEIVLRDIEERGDRFILETIEYWSIGDDAWIEAQVMADADDPDVAIFYDVLLTDRNLRWMPALTAALDSDERAIVVVGAAHLVGPNSLPDLLREAGFTVERNAKPELAAIAAPTARARLRMRGRTRR